MKEVTLDGAGALYEKYEQLKRELAEEGMFAPEYKQQIPKYIHTLGVVTADTGAAVRDIIQIASRRNPFVQIILYPALVQGASAAPSIVNGIRALERQGVDVTLICDNMSASVMSKGWVQAVFVGCDRVAANGDTANKIGTSVVAAVAKQYGVPVYICAPTSTIDMATVTGADICIEQRKAEEVTEMWYKERMAPEGVKVYNPAFDVTDHELIAGIVTEYGVARAPYTESLKEIMERKAQRG